MPLEAYDHKRIAEANDLAGTLHRELERLAHPPSGNRTDQERKAFRATRDAVGEARWRLDRIAEGRIDQASGPLPQANPEGD